MECVLPKMMFPRLASKDRKLKTLTRPYTFGTKFGLTNNKLISHQMIDGT